MNHLRSAAGAVALALFAAACGGEEEDAATSSTEPIEPTEVAYGAQVASYDLAAGTPQRFLVGLLATDNALVVGGEVTLDFWYLGSNSVAGASQEDGELKQADVPAAFTAVAGGTAPPEGEGPRTRQGDEGVGVYEATGVDFDEPGFWSVTVSGTVNGEPIDASAAFEVAPEHRIVTAGASAPRTANLLPGDPEAPVKAVDSRAEEDGSVPDPELHQLTVADAVATGRPTMVVVSTPVFCVSRFCGPITDSVQELAATYGDRANFVHIEVWRDFEQNKLNRGAAEWIYPDEEANPSEPWVFLIDGEGTIAQRWDNVANAGDLEHALEGLLQ
ncbi:MAG TPA: hypothetical protein VIR58_00520 [Acidimicrobiales bacterium]